MKTIGIQVKRYREKVDIINNNDFERKVLNLLLAGFGALFILYVVFLGNIVFNIVERKTLEAEARGIQSEVSDLELTYLSMSSHIDLPRSYELGFKEVKASYATRKPVGFNTTYNQTDLDTLNSSNEL